MSQRNQKVVVDHNVYLPPGVDDLVYEDRETSENLFEVVTSTNDDNPEQEGLPIPETMTVIKQNVKRNKDGTKVVDVIIETDDFPGTLQIDVRYAKE